MSLLVVTLVMYLYVRFVLMFTMKTTSIVHNLFYTGVQNVIFSFIE